MKDTGKIEIVDQKVRNEYKSAAYQKYFQLMKERMTPDSMKSGKEMLSIYFALEMGAAVLGRAIRKSGVKGTVLRSASSELKKEVLLLQQVKEDGKADELLSQYEEAKAKLAEEKRSTAPPPSKKKKAQSRKKK